MGRTVTFPGSSGNTGTGTGTGTATCSPVTGYLAVPPARTGPGLVLIQEWWGLVSHITSVADRFAAEGFVTLAPDFFHGITTGEPDEATKLAMGLRMDEAAGTVAAAARYISEQPECDGHVGAVGFSMGGSLALWSAALTDDIQAAVGFYPAMPWNRMRPDWHLFAGKAAVIHCADRDGGSANDGVRTATAGIERAGGKVAVYDYPGTRHAFFNDDRPEVYDHDAATVAWARTLELLRSQLRSSRRAELAR
jgi:carboxymethylenebutenolidase